MHLQPRNNHTNRHGVYNRQKQSESVHSLFLGRKSHGPGDLRFDEAKFDFPIFEFPECVLVTSPGENFPARVQRAKRVFSGGNKNRAGGAKI